MLQCIFPGQLAVAALGIRSAASPRSSSSRSLPVVRRLGPLIVTVALIPGILLAQLTTGAIEGILRAPDGRPVAGATILVTGGAGIRTVIYSNSNGEFAMKLPCGRYRLSGSVQPGAASSNVSVIVSPLRTARLDLVLETSGAIRSVQAVAALTMGVWTDATNGRVYSEALSLSGILLSREPSSVTAPARRPACSWWSRAHSGMAGFQLRTRAPHCLRRTCRRRPIADWCSNRTRFSGSRETVWGSAAADQVGGFLCVGKRAMGLANRAAGRPRNRSAQPVAVRKRARPRAGRQHRSIRCAIQRIADRPLGWRHTGGPRSIDRQPPGAVFRFAGRIRRRSGDRSFRFRSDGLDTPSERVLRHGGHRGALRIFDGARRYRRCGERTKPHRVIGRHGFGGAATCKPGYPSAT
jgi:hypothetical protein